MLFTNDFKDSHKQKVITFTYPALSYPHPSFGTMKTEDNKVSEFFSRKIKIVAS